MKSSRVLINRLMGEFACTSTGYVRCDTIWFGNASSGENIVEPRWNGSFNRKNDSPRRRGRTPTLTISAVTNRGAFAAVAPAGNSVVIVARALSFERLA